MAKNLSGELQIASANRLSDGAVVFLDDAGRWTTVLAGAAVARGEGAAQLLLERARALGSNVVEPLLVAITQGGDGAIEPVSLREKIRASGLTFDAIAAEAVRYA